MEAQRLTFHESVLVQQVLEAHESGAGPQQWRQLFLQHGKNLERYCPVIKAHPVAVLAHAVCAIGCAYTKKFLSTFYSLLVWEEAGGSYWVTQSELLRHYLIAVLARSCCETKPSRDEMQHCVAFTCKYAQDCTKEPSLVMAISKLHEELSFVIGADELTSEASWRALTDRLVRFAESHLLLNFAEWGSRQLLRWLVKLRPSIPDIKPLVPISPIQMDTSIVPNESKATAMVETVSESSGSIQQSMPDINKGKNSPNDMLVAPSRSVSYDDGGSQLEDSSLDSVSIRSSASSSDSQSCAMVVEYASDTEGTVLDAYARVEFDQSKLESESSFALPDGHESNDLSKPVRTSSDWAGGGTQSTLSDCSNDPAPNIISTLERAIWSYF